MIHNCEGVGARVDDAARARRAIGAKIRQARLARGWSQAQLAQALNHASGGCLTDAHYVSRWERGERKPGYEWAPVIDRVLGLSTDGAERDERPTLAGVARERKSQAPEGTARDLAGSNQGGSPAMVEPWKLADRLTRSTISTTTIDFMERSAAEYAARYPSVPPEVLLVSVSELFARVSDALEHSLRIKTRQRCTSLLGLLCGLTANLWLDLGKNDRASSFFDVGMLSAQEAEQPDLLAWLLANRSIGPFFANRHIEAADLLARAEEIAAVRSTGRRRAWIAALRARAAAASGDQEQSLAALHRAHQFLDAAAEPPAGTDFFDHPRLTGVEGSTYLWMSDTERSVPLLMLALQHRSPADMKGRALLTLDLAYCRAISCEPEEATRLALSALAGTAGTVVRPVVARARVIGAALKPWAELKPVQELSEWTRELSYER